MNPLTIIPAIHRASHAIAEFVDSHRELGVTQAEAHVLAHLAARGPSTVGQIHAEFGHKRSTLTSILNRLEERGLITCEVNETDRRSFVIATTPAGETVAIQIHEELLSLEDEILGTFSARDQRSALWLLTGVSTVARSRIEQREK